eukprot:1447012-Rhodomonas_salina.1
MGSTKIDLWATTRYAKRVSRALNGDEKGHDHDVSRAEGGGQGMYRTPPCRSFSSKSFAIVDFPAPLRPVNHTTAPLPAQRREPIVVSGGEDFRSANVMRRVGSLHPVRLACAPGPLRPLDVPRFSLAPPSSRGYSLCLNLDV